MKFFGTTESLIEWKQIISDTFDKEGSELQDDDGRAFFIVDLSDEERNSLHNSHWYEIADNSDMPWNWRIAFSE